MNASEDRSGATDRKPGARVSQSGEWSGGRGSYGDSTQKRKKSGRMGSELASRRESPRQRARGTPDEEPESVGAAQPTNMSVSASRIAPRLTTNTSRPV